MSSHPFDLTDKQQWVKTIEITQHTNQGHLVQHCGNGGQSGWAFVERKRLATLKFMDDDRIKIDLKGSVEDAAGEVAQQAIGTAFLLLLVGFLVAPVFATLFESQVEDHFREKYRDYDLHERIPLRHNAVAKVMRKVRLALWIIAAVGWACVLGCYANYVNS